MTKTTFSCKSANEIDQDTSTNENSITSGKIPGSLFPVKVFYQYMFDEITYYKYIWDYTFMEHR